MQLKDLVQGKELYTVEPEVKLCDCIKELNDKNVGALLVLDSNGSLRGIISERDILRTAFSTRGQMCDRSVAEAMTPADRLITANSREKLEVIMEKITTNRVRHLPVIENGALVGIVSIGDVVKQLLETTAAEKRHLEEYIHGN
jgi:CBS domain-containing protein